MTKKNFNPKEWLAIPEEKPQVQKPKTTVPKNTQTTDNDIENYIAVIENSGTDITDNYKNWRDIGFAFADAFGESGRDYFHRISKFYSDYDSTECEEQYTNCLNAKGHGVTMKSFYYLFHNAGLKIPKQEKETETAAQSIEQLEDNNVSTFPKSLFPQLPDFLQRVVEPATSDEERDILLLGALTVISACLHKIFGIYDGDKVFSNLYLFITAIASAGKGRLKQCKRLVMPIHKHLRDQAAMMKRDYEHDMAEYNKVKNKDSSAEKPAKPPERMLFIPANNSTTGVFQLLSDSKARGLIFETEGDTLAQAFKTDYGNYSDGFRKAFHHETISYYRRTDREYVDMEKPCLSTVLSGTPKQITALIPNAENGLFSRFLFYYMNIKLKWKNVFETKTADGLEEHYNHLGDEFFNLYKTLNNNLDIQITLSESQQERFNEFFSQVQIKYSNLQSDEYIATVRRMGLIAFRIMMIFTALRIMDDGDVSRKRECDEVDFENSLTMVKVLIKHSSKVFSSLPEEVKISKQPNRKERFLDSLPKSFNRQDYLDTATKLEIPHKTAEGYITAFVKAGLLHREKQDNYLNTTVKDD